MHLSMRLKIHSLPHSFSGLVCEVPPELWHAETGLQEQRGQAQQLHKHAHTQQQEGDATPRQPKHSNKQAVVSEPSPLPEILHLEVCQQKVCRGVSQKVHKFFSIELLLQCSLFLESLNIQEYVSRTK